MYTWCVRYNIISSILYTGWMKPGQPWMHGYMEVWVEVESIPVGWHTCMCTRRHFASPFGVGYWIKI